MFNSLYKQASSILKELYGEEAEFREGQFEAIEATLKNRRTLIVQKTGWGKSMVYFTATKLNRKAGKGVTIVVSPLLVLMDNQIEAAEKIGLKCEVINSTTRARWEDIILSLQKEEIDLILVTPESLFNPVIQNALISVNIGLFVIDEVHCISDWGHDFRLQYGNLYKIIDALPANVPLLGTTATANERVIRDLKQQWGDETYISRGPLTRESLYIQILNLETKVQRYGWILQNIESMPGSGIIYCLTQRDCEYLADFLQKNGINAKAYHAGIGTDQARSLEEDFKLNRIKVLVATVKLGMGYDKGDVAFIIHFQKPSNIVSYYQQIGRAGRNLDKAYVFLMNGKEDDDIINYFIDTAFPSEKECLDVLKVLETENGLNKGEIAVRINRKNSRIEKTLDFLENKGFIFKSGQEYYISAKDFEYDQSHYDEITDIRRREHNQMSDLVQQSGCISKYIANCLDDYTAKECGHCTNCLGRLFFEEKVEDRYLQLANSYINEITLEIKPRKMWERTRFTERKKIEFINEPGICLSNYGDVGYGQLVKEGKYGREKRFCNELVGRSAEILKPLIEKNDIKYITCVPSLRSDIVENFAKDLAEKLRINFVDLLDKSRARQQKEMENSSHQCENALTSFSVKADVKIPDRVLLVDDIVDSKWTLTVCGYKLMEQGCNLVLPFALADTSNKGDDNS